MLKNVFKEKWSISSNSNINFEKALKLNSLGIFFEKVFLLGVTKFPGLNNNLKII